MTRDSTRRFLERKGVDVPGEATSVYHIRFFEIDRQLVDRDACVAETDLSNKNSWIAIGDEELSTVLARLGVSLELLEPSFKSSYPL
jgi:hypothetical protein